MRNTIIFLKGLSMLGGLALIGVAAFLNVSKAIETEGVWHTSPICIAIVALAFGSALAWVVMLNLWRDKRRPLAVLALMGVICGESYSLVLSAERLLASREQRALQVVQAGSPYAQAKEALDLTIAERREECSSGYGRNCQKLRDLEKRQRAELSDHQAPGKAALLADTIGWPSWLVEIVPALLFSVGLQALGFVLVGYGGHGSHERTAQAPAAEEPEPDERERVVSWVRAYRLRHGRNPSIPDVQQAFSLPKTTAWRRIQSA